MISKYLTEHAKNALFEIWNEEKFVQEVGHSVFTLRLIKNLEVPDMHNVSRKEIRKKLDALKLSIDKVPRFVQLSIPGIDEVYERIQEPFENEIAPKRKLHTPIRQHILIELRNLFLHRLQIPISKYKDGLFTRTAEIIFDEIGVQGLDSHNLAREAADLNDSS